MGNQFLVDPKTGLINLHYDGLNPSDVMALIRKLEANLQFASKIITDPIKIMEQSAKRHPDGRLTFKLHWDAPEMEFDLDDVVDMLDIPEPNVELSSENLTRYYELVFAMSMK